MIRGFADSGRLLENKQYIEIAAKAADFVVGQMKDEKGQSVT